MKKIFSWLLIISLIVSLCPSVAFADGLTVYGNAVEIENAEGNRFDYVVSIKDNPGLTAIFFDVTWNKNVLKAVSYSAGSIYDDAGTLKIPATGNTSGRISVCLGDLNSQLNISEDGVLCTITFEVLEKVNPGNYDIELKYTTDETDFVNADMSEVSVEFESGSVTLYSILNSANISLATPIKDGTPQATVTGTGYTGSVTWSPEITNNKFEANTEYTATVVLNATTGYRFGENFAVDGYTVSNKSVSSVTLTKKFEKTSDKELTGIEVTTAPTNTAYEHGNTLDTAGMVVTATYDDNSTATITDYTVTYSNGNYLKKGDTTAKVTFGGKEATVNGLTVGTKKLTVTGLTATNRAYDGTTAVTLSGGFLVGVVSGETVTPVLPTSGTVADANAATGKAVTYVPITLSGGADADNYTVVQPEIFVDISKAELTADMFNIIVPQDKTYDGNTISIATPTLIAPYASDGLQLSVFVNGVKEDNVPADAGQYTITFDSPNGGVNFNSTSEKMTIGTVTIAPMDVTITGLSAENKTYDGNTAATVTGNAVIEGKVEGDDVSVTSGTAAFADAYAGTGKTVTFSGYTLTGAKAGNYNLTDQPANTTADINAKNVAESRDATNITVVKGVGSFTDPTFGNVTGDLTYSYGEKTQKEAIIAELAALPKDATGIITYTYTASGNYTGTITGSLNFTVVDVAFELADGAVTEKENPVYGDNWNDIVTIDPSKITAKVGDKVSTSAGYTVQNGGETPVHGEQTYTVLFSGVIDGRNYENAIVKTGTVNIAQKPITITGVTAENRPYNGETTVTLTGGTLNGVLDGETVTLENAKGTIDDKNVGSGKNVTAAYTLGGKDKDNYTLIQPTGIKVRITEKPLTVVNPAATEREYDGTVNVDLTAAGLDGIIGSEAVTIKTGAKGTVKTADAGKDKAVTTAYELDGVDKANYKVTQPADVTVTISPKTITISGVKATDRAYDGTNTVALTGGALNDVVSGDTVRFTLGSGTVDKNIGENKPVITNITLNNANYAITQPTDVKVNISAKELKVIGAKATDREYDGTDVVVLADGVLTGVVNGDTVTLENAKGTIDDKNVGSGKNVTAAYTLGGEDKDNYTLTQPTGIKVRITEKALTVVNPAATERKYDGTVNVELTATGLEGKVGTEDVTIKDGAKGTMVDANVGENKAVTTAYELDGDDKANYKITQPESVKVNITKADRDLAVEPETLTLLPNSLTANANAKVENDIDKSAVVTATSSDTSVASVAVNGKALTVKGLKNGTANITVNVAATDNYGAAVSKTIAVKVVTDPIEGITVKETVTGDNVSAALDGDTIKLTGLANNAENVSASISVDKNLFTLDTATKGKIIVKDKDGNAVKTYSIDKSALAQKDTEINVTASTVTENKIQNFAFNDNNTKAEGVVAAAGAEIQKIASAKKGEDVTEVDVAIEVKITGMSYENGIMTLDVTPIYTVTIKKSGEEPVVEQSVPLKSVSGDIAISVNLPNGFNPTIAKLIHGEKDIEYVAVNVSGGVATWKMRRFSDVELIAGKTFTVNYNKNDGSIESVAYDMTAIGKALNVDAKAGNTFDGWTFEGVEGTYKTMTEELFNKLSEKTEGIKATPNFTTAYSGGGGMGGGAAAKNGKVSVSESENGKVTVSPTSAKAGDTVAITATPNDGYTLKSLEVKDENGNAVAIENGEFTMPDGDVVITAVFVKAQKFVDVPADSYYADAVDWAVANGITNGVDETHFAPDATCTRAQAVTFLWRALGCPEPTATKSEFTDVIDANAFYYKAVLWAAENGVTLGYDDGRFGVDDTVNRGQMVTFMERAMKGKATTAESFTDVPEGAFYADAAAWAKENGVSTGIGNNKFGGEIDCLRAQIVTMLWRYFVK